MSPALRVTLKCPECGPPKESYFGSTGLHMLICRHATAAKRTKDETRQAWNVLATTMWQRKSEASAVQAASDSPPPAVLD